MQKDYYCEIRYHLCKANDVLSINEVETSFRVACLRMIEVTPLQDTLGKAQDEAIGIVRSQ